MKHYSAEYFIASGDWEYSLRAFVSSKERALVLVSRLENRRLDPIHPFSPLRGVTVSGFGTGEIRNSLAEIERPLKSVTRLWLFPRIQSAVRVLFPDTSCRTQIGVYIADPTEQKKLSTIFREALALIEEAS